MKELRKNKSCRHRQQYDDYQITRGKGGWEEVEETIGGINGNGKRLGMVNT